MPNFHVRLAYKGIKLSNLFSADAKPKISEEIQTTNCVYHFKCLCLSHYVGMTARTIKARATEHTNPSSAKAFTTISTVVRITSVAFPFLKAKTLNPQMVSGLGKTKR